MAGAASAQLAGSSISGVLMLGIRCFRADKMDALESLPAYPPGVEVTIISTRDISSLYLSARFYFDILRSRIHVNQTEFTFRITILQIENVFQCRFPE